MLRVSPANARFMAKMEANRERFNDFDEDQSWDAYKLD